MIMDPGYPDGVQDSFYIRGVLIMLMPTDCSYWYGRLHGTYQVGDSMEIQDPNRINMEENTTINNQTHILTYCGNKDRLTRILGQKLQLIEIWPICETLVPQFNLCDNLIVLQKAIIQKSYEECQRMNQELDEGAWLFCDLSSCCYIILSIESIEKKDIAKKCYLFKEQKNDAVLTELIQQLETTLDNENNILTYNKNHYEYRRLIEKSYNLEAGILERQYEGLALAWLLLNTERSETALRNFRETGEINNFEEFGISSIRDMRFSLLKTNTERFLSQASSLNDQSQIWATLNITMYLLEIAMQSANNPEESIDFMGLYPIINDNEQSQEELRTLTPIQYSPQFAYAFLCIPANLRYQFWSYLPQLLHEFFHYIPTDTREKRNTLLIHMLACFILGDTTNNEEVNLLAKLLLHQYKRLGHVSLLYQDSMSFISTMRVVLNRVDIPQHLEIEGKPRSNVQNIPSNLKQIEYLVEYTYFLREVRSDISMIELLNVHGVVMGLKEYIDLMVNQPKWAMLSAKEVAVETILRFGYMTEWIKRCVPGNSRLIVNEVIDELDDTNSDPLLKQKYTNLKQYLEEYHNEIRKINYCKYEIDQLADIWRQDAHLNGIKKSDFWKQFLNLYNCRKNDKSIYDINDAEFDYGTKLMLMDLHSYKQWFSKNE